MTSGRRTGAAAAVRGTSNRRGIARGFAQITKWHIIHHCPRRSSRRARLELEWDWMPQRQRQGQRDMTVNVAKRTDLYNRETCCTTLAIEASLYEKDYDYEAPESPPHIQSNVSRSQNV